MKEYRFRLEKYQGKKTKYPCPKCKTKNSFTKYIDIQNEFIFPNFVGRCDREDKCGYHYPPKFYFQQNPTLKIKNTVCSTRIAPPKTSYIQNIELMKSLKNYEQNNLYLYLKKLFGENKTKQLFKDYAIGTSDYWHGATVFWQIDPQKRIHAGKVMLYDQNTGHRIKQPYNHIHWMHSILKLKKFNLEQCFFGEHLVKYPHQAVAIVESEKTALIASGYYPSLTWIATGGKNNCLKSRLSKLASKQIVLFPDINAYDYWKEIVNQLQNINKHILISNYLEINANENDKKESYDIADFLIQISL